MSKRAEIFESVLNEYESDELRNFCIDMLETSPQNFWSMATQHYDFAGGLVVQTIAGCEECNRILKDLSIEKPKKRDCIRAAAMFRYVCPTFIIEKPVQNAIKEGLRKYIANLVLYYTKDKDQWTEEQKIIARCHKKSMCETSDISVDKDKITDVAIPDPENYFFPKGTKYADLNFWLVYEMDKNYLYWLRDSLEYAYVEEPLRTYLRIELEDEEWQRQLDSLK